MSNYTLIVSNEAASKQIRTWLSLYNGAETEIREFQLNSAHTLFLIAAGVESLVDTVSGLFFRGFAIDYPRQRILFGLTGLTGAIEATQAAVTEGVEGEYLCARFDTSGVRISRDMFGIAPLLHTSGPGYVALSDSMLVLSNLRDFTNQPRTQNDQVMLSRAVLNDMCGQQISDQTFMNEIHFTRIGEQLRVTLDDAPKLRSDLRAIHASFDSRGLEYVETVRTGARRMAGLMRGLSRVPGWPIGLSLSGGYDSRTCLAAATAAGVERNIRISTRNDLPVHVDDYRVASQLASHLGVTLNPDSEVPFSPPARSLECSPFTLWALSSLGIYDYFTFRTSRRSTPQVLGITGIGAELIKGNFEWQSWPEACARFDLASPVRSALEREGSRALEDLGCDPSAMDATEWHYLAFRNALHGSRHSPIRMSGLVPFQQRELVAIGKSPEVGSLRPGRNDPTMVNDISIVLDPRLTQLAYDKSEKHISRAYIEERLLALGGQVRLEPEDDFVVLGDVGSIPSGPSDFAIRLAEKAGMKIEQNSDSIIELGRRGLEVIQSPDVREVYSGVLDNAVWRLTVKGRPPVGAGASPAKLPAIYALFQ